MTIHYSHWLTALLSLKERAEIRNRFLFIQSLLTNNFSSISSKSSDLELLFHLCTFSTVSFVFGLDKPRWRRNGVNMFSDRARIFIKSGKGGDGHVSFRRELYVPDGVRTVVTAAEAAILF